MKLLRHKKDGTIYIATPYLEKNPDLEEVIQPIVPTNEPVTIELQTFATEEKEKSVNTITYKKKK